MDFLQKKRLPRMAKKVILLGDRLKTIYFIEHYVTIIYIDLIYKGFRNL
jgi:hypothetical protein